MHISWNALSFGEYSVLKYWASVTGKNEFNNPTDFHAFPGIEVTEVVPFLACPFMHHRVSDNNAKSLRTHHLTNRLWEFRQIYNVGTVGDKDELITFWGDYD